MKQTIVVVFAVLLAIGVNAQKKLDNLFYCFNNAVSQLPNAPQTYDEQAALVKKLGYEGLGGQLSQDNLALREAIERKGLVMPEVYSGMSMDQSGKISVPEALKELIRASGNHDLLVALPLRAANIKDHNDEIDSKFVTEIRKLADLAGEYRVDIALYPHTWFYLEESMHALKLAREADRPNVGVIFNTCHFLRVEGEKGWQKKLKKSMPYLKMVSIHGADSGDTKNMDWDRLIQPLGEGSFDTYKLVKYLKDKGYEGMFGLQAWGIKQDCEVVLKKSISTWRSYQERYAVDDPPFPK